MNYGGFEKMKKKIVIGLMAGTLLSSMPLNVYATGSATVNFKSNDTVEVGDTIKIYMSIEDITDAHNGIVGVGGKLNYDNEKLEFVEANIVDAPYSFWFNPKANKLAGLDFTFENAINKDTTIYEFTFKAINEGSTNITLDEAELSDSKPEILTTNVYGKNLTITKKAVEKETIKPVIKTTTKSSINKTIKAEVKPEVKEEITNKEKLVKVSNAVHDLLKKISNLF